MTDKPSATGTQSAPEEAKRTGGAISDFGIDTTSKTTGEAIGDYFAKVRGGELGSLPALAGLIVLVIYFATQSDVFLSLTNVANLFQQGAGTIIIAMGLVFVLLLGEIDLAAGTASGVCAAVMALHVVRNGNLLGGMGTTVFYVFCALVVVALGLALLMRIWAGAGLALIALLITLIGVPANAWLEMLLAIAVGGSIGCITGFLVAKIGMPSFVVTLALFITWQGVILKLIGEGGTLPIGSASPTLNAVANGNLSITGSWIFCVIVAGGYAAVTLGQHFKRLNGGLVTQPTPIALAKVAALAALTIVGTYLFTIDRSQTEVPNEGVPFVVPIVLGIMVIGMYVLNRTRYGRHIYAVGGNAEAARRAGINVSKIKASVFVVSSSLAAIGAIVYSSKIGSVDPQAGALNTLLFAVGAAVIGGTSLFGGKGRITDAVIGGTVIAVVQNGLVLLNYGAAEINIITGVVLLVAATVDALSRRRAAAVKS
ncbi:sugar ABC transporter permease [Kibdelosporangium phytohabitans]|uniref:Xylose transport system permease protein XylH n=1 Tax=Kibdelosporangium phytohabitans TaxID=860235 RepID=A0A0N9HX04_9PSEU|nr:ABC transporter permease [Kibdelosporangium phytohabitans]ALG07980.1 ABC transporter permease [Kibdelosporangium phytohabitans]MBE1471069.1 D-xylose transport system permease protein [Kibdelosporangium phytohabitans]